MVHSAFFENIWRWTDVVEIYEFKEYASPFHSGAYVSVHSTPVR